MGSATSGTRCHRFTIIDKRVVLLLSFLAIIWILASVRVPTHDQCEDRPLYHAEEARRLPLQSSSPAEKVPSEGAGSLTHQHKRYSSHRSSPHQHVYYLKTHKTGSTTMYSIFAEYCRSHDLLPLMPRGHHINQRPPVGNNQLFLADKVEKYDMVFNHHIYSPYILDSFMYNDTFTVTTLRQPLKHFISSFHYFLISGEFPYLNAIPGQNPMLEFLKNPKKYEADGYSSYTNNRQSMDLGYDILHAFDDVTYIQYFIHLTEQRFDLVLITELFNESLILLKRALGWRTGDIIYFSKNKSKETKKIQNETLINQLHEKISLADRMLYDHFVNRFREKLAQENNFTEEVDEFEQVLDEVSVFCANNKGSTKTVLKIPAKTWTDSVYFLPYKCRWLQLDEVSFTKYLQARQIAVLNPKGT